MATWTIRPRPNGPPSFGTAQQIEKRTPAGPGPALRASPARSITGKQHKPTPVLTKPGVHLLEAGHGLPRATSESDQVDTPADPTISPPDRRDRWEPGQAVGPPSRRGSRRRPCLSHPGRRSTTFRARADGQPRRQRSRRRARPRSARAPPSGRTRPLTRQRRCGPSTQRPSSPAMA